MFNKFSFRLSIHASAAKIQPDKIVRWCQNGNFLRPVFSASRVQHISDMHSKFALRPHHVWKYGRHPISDRLRLGEEKQEEERQKPQGKNIMVCPITQGDHKEDRYIEITGQNYSGLPYSIGRP